jgi:hypothetical protein
LRQEELTFAIVGWDYYILGGLCRGWIKLNVMHNKRRLK